MLNLVERNKKQCVEIEETFRAAGSYCMDQSYFRFLFRLAGKYKLSGLSKSEKSLAKRNERVVWSTESPRSKASLKVGIIKTYR